MKKGNKDTRKVPEPGNSLSDNSVPAIGRLSEARIINQSQKPSGKHILRKKKNGNPSVISRSTSCVNSKLGVLSQRLQFNKGKETSQNKPKLTFSSCHVLPSSNRSENENKIYNVSERNFTEQSNFDVSYRKDTTWKDKVDTGEQIMKSKETETQLKIELHQNTTRHDLALLNSTTVSFSNKLFDSPLLSSPSRLLRRRHTTYIKENSISKSSPSISEKLEPKPFRLGSFTDQFSSTSLNRSILRLRAGTENKNCQNASGLGVGSHAKIYPYHSWHRTAHETQHTMSTSFENLHDDLQEVR